MDILNVTADSFSDGGAYLDVDKAVAMPSGWWTKVRISSMWAASQPVPEHAESRRPRKLHG